MTAIQLHELATKRSNSLLEQAQPSVKSYFHLLYVIPVTITLKNAADLRLTGSSSDAPSPIGIFSGRERAAVFPQDRVICPLKLRCQPTGRARIAAQHCCKCEESCGLAGFGDRQHRTRKWSSMLGAQLAVHGGFCKHFMV